ncbi:phosphoadenosine phosphosulfate reductase family protein [Methanolobus sediminis]|uniref:Phosphoadenosine phosphosulfate reductase family protein n=1 Tax=Methanolobus sediminis TaxID=3072978 RepID=A0AA51YL97_9EURY|nr:phosphoadenosine phosphosulfate reductase family protein [Methanolobus sediminis]WMW24298.1 phosphoadenosine phosphosulfate reductase family protein [Methanolobus sediminis]
MVSMKKGKSSSSSSGKSSRQSSSAGKSHMRSAGSLSSGYRKSSSHSQKQDRGASHSKNVQKYASNEKDYIFWCQKCNAPLIEKECSICGGDGTKIDLSQPADVRFCSTHEREVLHDALIAEFRADPLGDRIILLNKIPGDDKTDEVIVDAFVFGILRFDMQKLDYVFEPSVLGAHILLESTEKKTVILKKNSRHLNGKKVSYDMVESMSDDIRVNDIVLIKSGNLTGFGVALCDAKKAPTFAGPVLRVRKVDSQHASLNQKVPTMDDVVAANVPHIRNLGRNAMNTIKGIANQKEYKDLPVNVSFSGGKDSLVVLDLTVSALKNQVDREIHAFFLNTGIEFPETVEFARNFCKDSNIELIEKKASSDFWDNVEAFGPPAKDFRWCCKICKLAPANEAIEECLAKAPTCITVDGKRRYESFSRARISTSENNPFVPGQLNIFPIKDWKAIEVWLYIYWRKLDYNPLYDLGFERVGCYLCPAALSAEYQRLKDLHPELHEKWEGFLMQWAKKNGLSDPFIEHGLWRWKELPPKMVKLCEEMGISACATTAESEFSISITSGISPCKAGGYTIEASIRGFSMKKTQDVMNIMGENVFSEELGLLMVRGKTSTIKIFSSGNVVVNSDDKSSADSIFAETSRQLLKAHRCTGCGICIKACPMNAISIENRHVCINESCTHCGKCTDSCVVLRYKNKL